MRTKHHLLQTIGNKIAQHETLSDSEIENFSQMTIEDPENGEPGYALFWMAQNLRHSGHLLSALTTFEESIDNCEGDPRIYYDCRNAIEAMANDLEKIAGENIRDMRIGACYQALLLRGVTSLALHGYAALHYLETGEKELGESMIRKIRAVAPGLPILKNIQLQKGESK